MTKMIDRSRDSEEHRVDGSKSRGSGVRPAALSGFAVAARPTEDL
jgi:hypothetical protein